MLVELPARTPGARIIFLLDPPDLAARDTGANCGTRVRTGRRRPTGRKSRRQYPGNPTGDRDGPPAPMRRQKSQRKLPASSREVAGDTLRDRGADPAGGRQPRSDAGVVPQQQGCLYCGNMNRLKAGKILDTRRRDRKPGFRNKARQELSPKRQISILIAASGRSCGRTGRRPAPSRQ